MSCLSCRQHVHGQKRGRAAMHRCQRATMAAVTQVPSRVPMERLPFTAQWILEWASQLDVRRKEAPWRTGELARKMGVVGLGSGDVGAQEVRRQPFRALGWRGRAALLVHRQHVRRQPPILLPDTHHSTFPFMNLNKRVLPAYQTGTTCVQGSNSTCCHITRA